MFRLFRAKIAFKWQIGFEMLKGYLCNKLRLVCTHLYDTVLIPNMDIDHTFYTDVMKMLSK